MKHWAALLIIVMLGAAAIVVSERRKVNTAADPAPMLYLVADTERELTRMPVKFTRMSDDEEVRLGNELARESSVVAQSLAGAENAEIQAYVSKVGQRLAAHAHRRLPYQFHYVPEKYLVNGYALPGGHVYIGEGLVSLMDSEDQLAAVLGHEIEHVDHYHCAERLQTERALRRFPLGSALPVAVFQAGYSKDQEMEADHDGTKLIVESGYSANGTVRMFQTFDRLYHEAQERAASPQEELSQVAAGALEGYFRSHPLPKERIAQVNQMIASEDWTPRAETDLAVAYFFWTDRAQDYLAAGKYAQAVELASRAVQMQPNNARALTVLAQAQFAQAQFAAAAISYRRIFEVQGWTIDWANAYALTLAAAERRTAASTFRQWMALASGDTKPLQLQLDGLLLLVGDAVPARRLLTELNLDEPNAPSELSDLSWWFYLSGDYSAASGLQNEAAQRRPADQRIEMRFAWINIELRRFGDAFQAMNMVTGQQDAGKTMARAVAEWQSQQHEAALRDFSAAADRQPEWSNSRWVESLYAPLVVSSVQEMRAEHERRRKSKTGAKG